MTAKPIAIIPARGGSKRIPRKNIREFCGKPMIAWTIEAAKASGVFAHIIVSTDDDEIADIAQAWGAEAPFRRPADLADDHTPTRPVVIHAIEQAEYLYGPVEYACWLYPAAPFIDPEDIRAGYEAMIAADTDFAFSVTSFPSAIQRALRILPSGRVEMYNPEFRKTRTQDLEPAYHDAAQFYWGKVSAVKQDIPTFGGSAVPIVLPRDRVQDIDTPEDWLVAERMFAAIQIAKAKA